MSRGAPRSGKGDVNTGQTYDYDPNSIIHQQILESGQVELIQGGDSLLEAVAREMAGDKRLAGYADNREIVSEIANVIRGQEAGGSVSDSAMKSYSKLNQMLLPPDGYLYRTEIDVTLEGLLDWFAPFEEQGEAVQGALRGLARQAEDDVVSPSMLSRRVTDAVGTSGIQADLRDLQPHLDGSSIYELLEGVYGTGASRELSNRASRASSITMVRLRLTKFKPFEQWLKETHGMEVADSFGDPVMSRALDREYDGYIRRYMSEKPEQTHNYVIFDDGLISIAERQ